MFCRISTRNVLEICMDSFRLRKMSRYYYEWMEHKRVENILKFKLDEKRSDNMQNIFSSWVLFTKKVRGRKKLCFSTSENRSDNMMKSVFNMLLYKITKKYEVLQKMQDCMTHCIRYRCRIILHNFLFLRRNRRAVKFFITLKFFAFVRYLKKRGKVLKRHKFAMSLGNKVIVRKLFKRWKMKFLRIDDKNYDENDNEIINIDNDVTDTIRNDEINIKICPKKSWETILGRQEMHKIIKNHRNGKILLEAFYSFIQFKKYSKKNCKLKLYCYQYYENRRKYFVIRSFVDLIRIKHRRNRENYTFNTQLCDNLLRRSFNKLDLFLTFKWIGEQKIRLATYHARLKLLKRGIRKLFISRTNCKIRV